MSDPLTVVLRNRHLGLRPDTVTNACIFFPCLFCLFCFLLFSLFLMKTFERMSEVVRGKWIRTLYAKSHLGPFPNFSKTGGEKTNNDQYYRPFCCSRFPFSTVAIVITTFLYSV